jgi:DNA-binding MarR family transcriptional regulator
MPLVPPRTEKLEALAQRFPVIDAGALETCIWLLRTASTLGEVNDLYYARHGFSRGRFHALILLFQSPAHGLTPAELAEEAGVTRAAMTGVIESLVESDYVARIGDASDRRTYRVRLTEKAFDFLNRFLPGHFRRLARLVRGFSEEDHRALRRLLAKVAGQLDQLEIERPEAGLRAVEAQSGPEAAPAAAPSSSPGRVLAKRRSNRTRARGV